MIYRVGDRVKIIDNLEPYTHYGYECFTGDEEDIKKYEGQVGTVESTRLGYDDDDSGYCYCWIKFDSDDKNLEEKNWGEEALIPLVLHFDIDDTETYDRVIFKDGAQGIIMDNKSVYIIKDTKSYEKFSLINKEEFKNIWNDIKTIERPCYEPFYESTKLSLEEYEYLNNVIKPFRHNVKYIEKTEYDNGYALDIYTEKALNDINATIIRFPVIEKDFAFKNLELNIQYTPKELGLEV